MSRRPRVLLLSFSTVTRDARVLRQLRVVAECADVTTVGYGTAPADAADHIQLPSSASSLPRTPSGVAALVARRFSRAARAIPAARCAWSHVRGRQFELVIANEARTLPLALQVARGAPVWADMHEWAPDERSQVRSWRWLVRPLMEHICRTQLPSSAVVTTVGDAIARRYAEEYGVSCRVVRNAPQWQDLEPEPVPHDGLRLVHAGGAIPGRNLEALVDATLAVDGLSLDFYLLPASDGGRYLRDLHGRSGGDRRIRFREPVPPDMLVRTLNRYDVGVYSLPPVNVNASLALPNKFFDFVQARLAVAMGPSPEMERMIRERALGVITSDFSAQALSRALQQLTPAQVTEYKRNAHRSARELSSDHDDKVIRDLLSALLS